jgi:hypothetical protein
MSFRKGLLRLAAFETPGQPLRCTVRLATDNRSSQAFRNRGSSPDNDEMPEILIEFFKFDEVFD